MFCKKCGKEVKEGTVFCGFCGASTGQAAGPQKQSALPPIAGGPGAAAAGASAGKGSIGELLVKNRLAAICGGFGSYYYTGSSTFQKAVRYHWGMEWRVWI